uniref:Putative ribonuclease H-like domain-containing protein n=1 Tax=Tanacetum cinerariifolium TaxID=118510 RepID=A0A6L2KX08_TANCI|nr:putative ribonuclease H-like domain-containing protein [Tanacetum cinerariifolium]
MVQPEGFVNPKHSRHVCKLQRSIYGFKQVPRNWNKRFDEEIKKYGFTQNPNEPCVYKRASGGIVIFLILYVDDILLMGNNIPILQDVKSWLGKCFAMKDLGSIMYATWCTKTDIAFSQNLTSRYQQNPGESYWTAMKNILKYLRNTKDMFLVYGGDSTTEVSVTCYTNASWEIDRDNLRSQTGYVFVINKGAVDWKCSKQGTAAISSIHMDMYCENTGAITIVDEPEDIRTGRIIGRGTERDGLYYVDEVVQSDATIGNEIQNHSTTSAEAPNISATPEHPVPNMISEDPRAWFGRFTLAIKRYGFKQSNSEHTRFLKNKKNHVTCLIIYVDDMVITGNDEEEIKRLKEGLFIEFKMKDLGNLKYFLGIEVLRSPKGIFIFQKKYILDLLAEIGMINCKPADTPMMVNHKLFMEKKAKLADRNRVVSRFMHQPQVAHMNTALRIVSKKQKVVSLSSAEAEFKGIAKGLAEALWIRKLVSEIGFLPQRSTQIICDNKAAILISKNPVQHDMTKHVKVDRHFIKEKLEAGIIELPFVNSSDQLADILTKAVGTYIFHKCLSKLNFGNPTIQLEGECWKRK